MIQGICLYNEVLTAAAAKENGKHADTIYIPNALHSRPYYGYDVCYAK